MWVDVSDEEAAARDNLIDHLRAAGVRYLGGGHGPSPATYSKPPPIDALIRALTYSRDARLRAALTALFLHQPCQATAALRLAATLDDPRGALRIRVSVLAAAALQQTWAFSFDLYQPGWARIEAGALADALGVPAPDVDYGRATLRALHALLGGDHPTAPDYLGAWEDVGRHVIDDLRAESVANGA